MLGLLWPDIREMLLTEMNFEEKYVREHKDRFEEVMRQAGRELKK